MFDREVMYIIRICQEVDWLVSRDPGTASMEVLEGLRLRMNDFLRSERWREAEDMAYRIHLLQQGCKVEAGGFEKRES